MRAWLERNGVSEDVERGVVLAVSEAAANAVEHGYGCNGTGLVSVTARHEDEGLDITVRDEGEWREPRNDTDRGRGLAIIRAIVDEMWIGRTNGATVMHMRTRARESAVV
jgi:serine/threonine-protein kinase RsbW